MPLLSIIPAAALADEALTDLHIRVLCAIGTFTSRLGGEMWASVSTLAKACCLSERSVQRALPVLLERGYLRKQERPGRTNLYEVVLGVTMQSPGGDQPVTPGVTTQSPKRLEENDELNDKPKRLKRRKMHPDAQQMTKDLYGIFPRRDTSHPFVPALEAVSALLEGGASREDLMRAAAGYARYVAREKVEPRYVKGLARFFSDGVWEEYRERTVHGLTRAEWIRSGQNVELWDAHARGAA